MYQLQVSFGDAVRRALTVNYCNFSGRASRSEYWWFMLFEWIVSFALAYIFSDSTILIYLTVSLFSLAVLLPSLGLAFRRLHDTGRSAWWLLLSLIPLGNIVVLIFLLLPSQMTPNQWGPVPNLTA